MQTLPQIQTAPLSAKVMKLLGLISYLLFFGGEKTELELTIILRS